MGQGVRLPGLSSRERMSRYQLSGHWRSMQLQGHYCDGCNRIFEECACYPEVVEEAPHPADSGENLVTQVVAASPIRESCGSSGR